MRIKQLNLFKRVAELEKEVQELRYKKSGLEELLEAKFKALDTYHGNKGLYAVDSFFSKTRAERVMEGLAKHLVDDYGKRNKKTRNRT